MNNVLLYFSWSRPGETGAPLGVLENRFPALFETRRMRYPNAQELADPARFDQGIAGFLDHVQKPNFAEFAAYAAEQSGRPVVQVERGRGRRQPHPVERQPAERCGHAGHHRLRFAAYRANAGTGGSGGGAPFPQQP